MLAQTVQKIGNARRVFFPSSSPPGGSRTSWITSEDGRMAPLSRTPPGDESRTKFVLGPRQVPKNASSRRCELAEREFSERVCEKLDDCWWSMKVTGKYSPGPKPFAKSHRLLALRALWAEKHDFCTIFVYSGLEGIYIYHLRISMMMSYYSKSLEYLSPSYFVRSWIIYL